MSPGVTAYTEENPADIQLGEAYSASVINAVMGSPAWPKTVLLFMYDEHGGYYDHVAPPAAIPPTTSRRASWRPPTRPAAWNQYGLRVPAFVISPFAKRNYVSHVVHDHTSVLRFIETKFNLGALTRRDANADNLLDCLDFHRPPAFLEPPTLAAPGLPATGSRCQPADPSAADVSHDEPGATTMAMVGAGVGGARSRGYDVPALRRVDAVQVPANETASSPRRGLLAERGCQTVRSERTIPCRRPPRFSREHPRARALRVGRSLGHVARRAPGLPRRTRDPP